MAKLEHYHWSTTGTSRTDYEQGFFWFIPLTWTADSSHWEGSAVVKLSLDTNLFYDVTESRAGATDVEALFELSRQRKVMLYSTATTDFEDQSGAATQFVLNRIKEGKLQEAPNAGTHREFMPGGPGLHHIEEQECESLLQDIWPTEQWKSASDNKRSDVLHLLASQRNKHNYFVTNDRELLSRQAILKTKHAIAVISPHEFLKCYDLPTSR